MNKIDTSSLTEYKLSLMEQEVSSIKNHLPEYLKAITNILSSLKLAEQSIEHRKELVDKSLGNIIERLEELEESLKSLSDQMDSTDKSLSEIKNELGVIGEKIKSLEKAVADRETMCTAGRSQAHTDITEISNSLTQTASDLKLRLDAADKELNKLKSYETTIRHILWGVSGLIGFIATLVGIWSSVGPSIFP